MLGTMGRKRKDPDVSLFSGRLAARIRELRMAKFATQEEFAIALRTSVSVISAWETGARQPRYDDLPRIAAALGKSVRFLLPSD